MIKAGLAVAIASRPILALSDVEVLLIHDGDRSLEGDIHSSAAISHSDQFKIEIWAKPERSPDF